MKFVFLILTFQYLFLKFACEVEISGTLAAVIYNLIFIYF